MIVGWEPSSGRSFRWRIESGTIAPSALGTSTSVATTRSSVTLVVDASPVGTERFFAGSYAKYAVGASQVEKPKVTPSRRWSPINGETQPSPGSATGTSGPPHAHRDSLARPPTLWTM